MELFDRVNNFGAWVSDVCSFMFVGVSRKRFYFLEYAVKNCRNKKSVFFVRGLLLSVIQFNFLNVFDAYVFIFFKHQNF